MTFEEMQQVFQQIFAIQRNLQEGQLKLQESQQADRQDIRQMLAVQQDLQESQQADRQDIRQMLAVQQDLQESQLRQLSAIEKLLVQSERQERIMNQLIGYSISNESDHLDLEEKIRALGTKVKRLENQNK